MANIQHSGVSAHNKGAQSPLDSQALDLLEPHPSPAGMLYSEPAHAASISGSNPFVVMRRLLQDMDFPASRSIAAEPTRDSFQSVFEQVLWSPDLEVFARGDDLVVRTVLLGLNPEDIRVELEDGVLCISCERRADGAASLGGTCPSEFANVSFVRRLTLPLEVREQDLNATFHEGVLEVSFPGA